MDLKKIFEMLDKDGDGDTNLNDIMGLIQDPQSLSNVLSGNGDAKQQASFENLLSNAATEIVKGESNDAINQLSQAGISASSIGDLLGGLLGKDTSTPANKNTLDTMLQGTLGKLTGSQTIGSNQTNQLLDIVVKVIGSKVASDTVGKVVGSFMGNMMNDVKQDVTSNSTQEVDLLGDVTKALQSNNVDETTTQDIVGSIMSSIKNLK